VYDLLTKQNVTEVSLGKLKAALILTFVTGFVLGYRVKEWRIKWMKWRRNRLAAKLVETLKKLEVLIISW
jgi:hypothetical protein